jgi:hypothetical protein
MNLKITAFAREDTSSLVRLLNDEYANSYEFIPYAVDKLLKEIEERNLTVLVARGNGEVLGCIALHAGHHGEHIEWLAFSQKASTSKLLKKCLSARWKSGLLAQLFLLGLMPKALK